MSGPQVFVVSDGDARWEQALEGLVTLVDREVTR
jgi:hypothetical protein